MVVLVPVVFTLPATVTDPLLLVLPMVRLLMPEPASLASVSASTLRVGADAAAGLVLEVASGALAVAVVLPVVVVAAVVVLLVTAATAVVVLVTAAVVLAEAVLPSCCSSSVVAVALVVVSAALLVAVSLLVAGALLVAGCRLAAVEPGSARVMVVLATCSVPVTVPAASTVRLLVPLELVLATLLSMETLPELMRVTWVPSVSAALTASALMTLVPPATDSGVGAVLVGAGAATGSLVAGAGAGSAAAGAGAGALAVLVMLTSSGSSSH